MPVFQSCPYHVDNIIKRKPGKDDIEFLSTLQTVLNTQHNMGNADPVFWVIAGRKAILCSDDDAPDKVEFWLDDECYDLPNEPDIKQFEHAVKSLTDLDIQLTHACGKVHLHLHDPRDGHTEEYANIYLTAAIHKLNSYLESEQLITVNIVHMKYEHYVYPDTFFLTHEAAEDHLRTNGHNYDPTAHAYAMTATRSPQVETLWRLLRELDFSSWKGVNP